LANEISPNTDNFHPAELVLVNSNEVVVLTKFAIIQLRRILIEGFIIGPGKEEPELLVKDVKDNENSKDMKDS